MHFCGPLGTIKSELCPFRRNSTLLTLHPCQLSLSIQTVSSESQWLPCDEAPLKSMISAYLACPCFQELLANRTRKKNLLCRLGLHRSTQPALLLKVVCLWSAQISTKSWASKVRPSWTFRINLCRLSCSALYKLCALPVRFSTRWP